MRTGSGESGRAAAALRDAGFAHRKLRIFTDEQILDDYARYVATVSSSVNGSVFSRSKASSPLGKAITS